MDKINATILRYCLYTAGWGQVRVVQFIYSQFTPPDATHFDRRHDSGRAV